MRSLEDRAPHQGGAEGRGPGEVRPSWRRRARTVGVTMGGGSMLLAGLVMLVLPGPGLLVLLGGLALLATEYSWAKVLLHKAREWGRRVGGLFRKRTEDAGRQAPAQARPQE